MAKVAKTTRRKKRNELNDMIGHPYVAKSPYVDGFDAACWLGRYWDWHKITDMPIPCHPKYKQGTKEWDRWHEGYADGMDELVDFKDDILRDDPPEHQFVERNESKEIAVESVGGDCEFVDMEDDDE